jgi:hypothetical protein
MTQMFIKFGNASKYVHVYKINFILATLMKNHLISYVMTCSVVENYQESTVP